MKQWQRLIGLAVVFIRKDWVEFRKAIILISLGLLVPVFMVRAGAPRPDFARGMMGGVLLAGPFLFAQSCFLTERQHGTLQFLLALPITPSELVLAKYASLFSMTLFTVNAPGLLLGDPAFLFYANTASLLLASLFMAATVISDKPWAAQLPLWFVIMATMPLEPLLRKFYPDGLRQIAWIAAHHTWIACGALALTPLIVLGSIWIFARKSHLIV